MVAPDRSIEDAALIAFVRKHHERALNAHRYRIEEAAAWRDGSEAEHESGREMAERSIGRPIPKHTPDEREEIAKRSERIAEKDAEEVRLFTALLSRLEGRGTEQADVSVKLLAIASDLDASTVERSKRGVTLKGIAESLRALASSPASVATGAAADGPDVRGIIEAMGFDPTSHHNALVCAYCNPDRLTLASPAPLPDAAPVAWLPIEGAPRDSRPLIGYRLKLPERWIRVGLGTNLDGDWMWSQDVPWEPATHYQLFVPPVSAMSPIERGEKLDPYRAPSSSPAAKEKP